MQILSYVLSILAFVAMVTASLVKGRNMKLILALVCTANVFVGVSYHIGGSGINGAAACYLGAVITFINFFFESKQKDIPKWLISIYALAIVVLNIWVAGGITFFGMIALVASLSFIMCIIQKNGKKYRFWTILNMLLWCTYDAITASYSVLLSHVAQLIFTVAGMVIHDRKNK